jgi:hypothetical protein
MFTSAIRFRTNDYFNPHFQEASCVTALLWPDENVAFSPIQCPYVIEMRSNNTTFFGHFVIAQQKLTLANIGIAAEVVAGPLAKSALWQSATHYVATRFARTRGRGRANSPADFLISDLLGQAHGFCQRCFGAELKRVAPVLRAMM